MSPGLLDRFWIRLLIWTRELNQVAIERWSRRTFRRRRAPEDGMPELEAAMDHYRSPDIPGELRVPRKLPADARLRASYLLPYYIATALVFKLYRRRPIRPEVSWRRDFPWNRAFPGNEEGWQDTMSDAAFARLRLQGPNPFLLRRADEEGRFELDYSPYFEGIHPPTVCRFRLADDGHTLLPESIRIGDDEFLPGAWGWETAKLRANALDARYSVFTRHVLETHLLVGEAFAVSAYALPADHALRPFLDLFTYGTLVVNDFGYKLLITPVSYFLQSNFISGGDAMTLFRNSMDVFDLDDLIVPRDIARRGIDKIPNHPYVEDATNAWELFHGEIRHYLDTLYPDDEALRADADVQGWYTLLAELLPNRDAGDAPLDGRARLADLLCCLLYNNVSHEVCGDFSPFGQSQDPEHKKLVDFEKVKRGDLDEPARAADVFLFDQGAFAARFNNGGNNLLKLEAARWTEDAGLRRVVHELQRKLRLLDRTLEARNRERQQPFYRMMPRYWEASISF